MKSCMLNYNLSILQQAPIGKGATKIWKQAMFLYFKENCKLSLISKFTQKLYPRYIDRYKPTKTQMSLRMI